MPGGKIEKAKPPCGENKEIDESKMNKPVTKNSCVGMSEKIFSNSWETGI